MKIGNITIPKDLESRCGRGSFAFKAVCDEIDRRNETRGNNSVLKRMLTPKMWKIFYSLLLIFSFAPFAHATTYATWNPSDKGACITLSGGNLVAVASSDYCLVRSTISKTSGKWYWEYTLTALKGGPLVGVATGAANINNYVGSDAAGWSWYSDTGTSNKWNNNVSATYSTIYATGDVVGVALDMDGGTITMYKNGVSQGPMYTGLSGTMYAAITPSVLGGGDTITTNFGATTLAYTPPAGFCAGLVDVCPGGAIPSLLRTLLAPFWIQ